MYTVHSQEWLCYRRPQEEQKLAAAACQKVTMAEGGQKNDSNCTEVRLS